MRRNLATPVTAIAFVVGCSGSPRAGDPPARPPEGPPPATAPAGDPGAPPVAAVDAKPDTPAGADAKRDAELGAKAAVFLDAYTNGAPVFTRDGKRVAFVSNRDGLPQIYLGGAKPDDPPTRLLTTKQRMTGLVMAPGGKDLLFRSDTGADEHWAFYRVGLDGKNLVELTAGERLNRDGFVVPDGKPSTLYFTGRKMSEAKSTLYSASATAAGPAKAIYTDAKPAFLLDVSANGATALVLQYVSGSENYVLRVDTETGKADRLYPAEGKMTIWSAALARDGKRAYIATDHGEESALVLAVDLATGKQLAKYVVTPPTTLVSGLTVAKEGNLLALSLLVGQHSEIKLLDAKTLAPSKVKIDLPLGQGGASEFSEDGKRLAIGWSTPQAPTNIFSVDVKTGKVEALRRDTGSTLKDAPAIETTVVDIPAFDGGKIPTNVYRPAGADAKPRPVIVSYHGGPAGVSVIRWNPATAFWLSQGYIVVEPNVRGSSGFGRAFEAGDNGTKRLDAFKDIETSGRWAAAQPWADKSRVVVSGGSYGGYTTLIALSRWPEIWRAGVNLFGVVNMKTFMATTSGLIRDIFLVEFGDPDKDADFFASISPLTDVGKIVDPTFVYAGANDPRVPMSESDLIVKALRQRKVPSEYMVAYDEGHSLARRENQIAFYGRCARFLEQHLK